MVLYLQCGNARIDSSGSIFRQESNGVSDFIMLVEEKTDDALTVRDYSTLPDTPIIALFKGGFDNQMWEYSTPVQFVSIDYIPWKVIYFLYHQMSTLQTLETKKV